MPIQKLIPQYVRVTPAGGWKFTVPEYLSPRLKGVTITASDQKELFKKTSDLFKNNNELISTSQFEEALCSQLPPQYCNTCGDKGIEWKTHEPLTARKIFAFFSTMLLWWRRGHGFVGFEEAKRRYDICSRCPHATRDAPPLDAKSCITCDAEIFARRKLKEQVSKYPDLTQGEPELYCVLCGCDLSVKAYFDIDSECWK